MRRALSNLGTSVVQAYGFFAKEIGTVLHQPRLIASLVLGPFGILLLFGLGYRGPHPEFRTVLVVPQDPAIADKVNAYDVYREGLSGVFRLTRITSDEESALAELRNGQADVVVVVPADLYATLVEGRQARLRVYYTETDPTSNAWVQYFTSVQVRELNRRILVAALRQLHQPAVQALDVADQADAELAALESDVREHRVPAASERADRVANRLDALPSGLGAALDALATAISVPDWSPGEADRALVALEEDVRVLRADLASPSGETAQTLERVRAARADLETFRTLAREVSDVPIETLVSPLAADAENMAPVEPSPVAFFAPAVIALLLQHIAVTLGSLSSVRDRLLGSLELFRVSPVGAEQILVGKAVGYALLLAVVAVALTVALVNLLEVPLLGSASSYALVVAITIFASVGLGFALSVFAASESQAVQLSMLVLLTSVFFGGFALPTNLLLSWVRIVTNALPVSYGAIGLRDVMLGGTLPDWPILAGPVGLGVLFYGIALLGLRRQMRRA